MMAHGVSRGFRAFGRSSPGGAQDSRGDSVCTQGTGKTRRETYKPLQTGCFTGRKASGSILNILSKDNLPVVLCGGGRFCQDGASMASLVQPGA